RGTSAGGGRGAGPRVRLLVPGRLTRIPRDRCSPAERAGQRAGGLMAGSGQAHLRPQGDALLSVKDLVVEFPVGRTGLRVNAVSGISFDVLPGETLGLVGESGCGKSTTGRAVMQLPRPTGGHVRVDGQDLTTLKHEQMRQQRTQVQMIFQDPISSLN